MVRVRLKRTGTRNVACFRVVVMDKRSSRDGKAIEELGFYDPRSKEEHVNLERVDYWKGVGASFSETVEKIVERIRSGKSLKDVVRPAVPSKKAKAKAEAEARSRVFIEATKRLERQIKEFAEAHRDDMDGKKTKTLNFGAVGFRKSTKIKLPKAPTKLAEIIQLLRSKGMDDCVKTPAPSVDKDALRKYPTQDIVAVGASIEVDDVFWYEPDREKLERG